VLAFVDGVSSDPLDRTDLPRRIGHRAEALAGSETVARLYSLFASFLALAVARPGFGDASGLRGGREGEDGGDVGGDRPPLVARVLTREDRSVPEAADQRSGC
jgi:hypothetical protein